MRKAVQAQKDEEEAEKKAEALKLKLERKKKRRVVQAIKRVNTFEREWIENVRYEIYWKDKMAEVIEMLRQHVKYARV